MDAMALIVLIVQALFGIYIYNTIIKIDLYYQGIGLSTTTKIMTSKYGKITLYEENQIKKT